MVEANVAVIDEMREDRRHFHHERSVEAAARLTAALTATVRDWTLARDDSSLYQYGGLRSGGDRPEGYSTGEKRWRAVQDWRSAYLNDRGAIQPVPLRDDLERFTRIIDAATNDWDTVLALVAQQHGEREEQLREDRDNRPYRIGLAADRLRRRLEDHRQGNALVGHALPKDYRAFWTARLTLADEDLDEMIDD